ncbi:HypC/HybG/HupF family hydrogenase formation chaperone [Roseicyclus sp.]|uniref:HypC/HybG/HupF family hydrogenase formation chaperone n=1 Tax=Roseicyclus sp. TaxID=1914329 RepID=UPI003FA14CEF
MCIGIPVEIVAVEGILGHARDGAETLAIDLSLTGPVPPGTWVLNFLGTAREVLDPDEALRIRAAVGALRSVMAGGGVGDAFDDIEARGPQLPPHLRAAQAAGKTTA